MTDSVKLELLRQMLTDFWGCRDRMNIDEARVLIDMINTVLEFKQD